MLTLTAQRQQEGERYYGKEHDVLGRIKEIAEDERGNGPSVE